MKALLQRQRHQDTYGIYHGDKLAFDGKYPGVKYPIIPGHEIVGLVESAGGKAAKNE